MNINGDIYWALLVYLRAQDTVENKAKSKKLRNQEYQEERKIKRRKSKKDLPNEKQ
jgi:hypothetical protein